MKRNGHRLVGISEVQTISILIILLESDCFLDIINFPIEGVEYGLFKIDVIYLIFV